MAKVILKPVNRCVLSCTIKSVTPMIQHKWSEKAKEMMRLKHAGKKTKSREVRDPEAEFREAAYLTDDGQFGLPGMGFKAALITAAHKDIGVEKTLVRKALFLRSSDSDKILPMECDEPVMREDCVRVGAGSADLRYRPQFDSWKCHIEIEVDADLLTDADVINLINRAGFGVGIGEMRPEKGGEYGRFEVDSDSPVSFGAEA